MNARDVLSAAVEREGALPVPMGHARSFRHPAPQPSAADVPLPVVEAAARRELRRYAALRARINRDLADPDTQPDTTPEEGSK